ncbi:hypothetical protein CTI12_AA397110 [Artemisia annua]|uniref:Membrane protein of ER body-like protein n=1 Tax=Artemisia annua TaxID=35608 RepID=A0A2U1MAZ2_ARTAN|nr:hypothetical protein CTI12_AA397110 [Artemisia annua]
MEVLEAQPPWDQQQQHEEEDVFDEEELEESLITRKKNTNNGIWKCRICPWDNQGRTCLTHHYQHPNWHSHRLVNVKTVYVTKGTDVLEANGVAIAKGKSLVLENTQISTHNQENGNGVHSPISNQNGEHKKDNDFSEIESLEHIDKSSPSSIKNKSEISEIQVIEDGDDEIAEFDVETVVILRKRKRRIPVPGEDSKRNKPENPAPSEVNVASSDSGDNQAQYRVDPRIDEVQPLISNEYDHQREPDVFRCLSCFSIFMPTGNGFKLFRMFGNKSNEESNQPSQKEVPVKRHWFSKFFASDKVEQGAVQSLNATNNIAGVSAVASNLNTPRQEANSPVTNGGITTDSPVVADTEQLLTSYNTEESNDKSDYPGMFVVKPPSDNVEAAENSISPLQNDGLKLVIPPNVGSLIIDNSQMNQELDVTVQTSNSDISEKGSTNLSFSPPNSSLGQLNLGGQKNDLRLPTNLAINGKEQKMYKDKGKDTIITIENMQPEASACEISPDVTGVTGTLVLQQVAQGGVTTATGGGRSLDIVKSIVYGGLMEVIASLSVVFSAAGADAATLNVLALGLANIFGGLFVIGHDLWDLKNDRARKKEDRYQQFLGQRADFPLHVFFALLSYLIFGFVPPVVYGFSFRESNDKDFKVLTVAAASMLCIIILAAGKAYIQCPRKSYLKTIAYYVVFGFMTSGASYLFGGLIMKLLEKIDIFHSGSVENLIIPGGSSKPSLATF